MKFVLGLPVALLLANSAFALSKGYYYFAHCEKGGSDWTFIQNGWCTGKWGALDGACNGVCLDNNRRYCAYDYYSNDASSKMCEFKKWCEKDGYVAKAKSCSYDQLKIPNACSDDHVILC
ncbi:hypothetical protein BGX20_001868 [Mortierella sp. AD010]|nr:hypothetical protein BGX20_001868 [Mortierella sp. AD010]